MQYTELGRSGLRVSRLCLGTMNFGVRTSEEESQAIMDRAFELGLNFYDTADRYGTPMGQGVTEQIVGRWLQASGKRDEIVLATKVFGPMGAGANNRGLSAYHLRRGCNASLERLQTDHIDLYQMHHIDLGTVAPHHKEILGEQVDFYDGPCARPGTPWAEVWQGFEQLINEGKITYVGSSNFAAWNIAQANETAAARQMLGLVSEQSKYNLSMRLLELEVIPACKAYGVGLMCYSPLGGGYLAGALQSEKEGRRATLNVSPQQRKQLEDYEGLCADIGEKPAQVALAWLLHQPVVTCPIIGPRTMEQLESAVAAMEIKLSASTLSRLDEIFPGYKQAPMEYAW